ncbi:MAG: ankyrin repeat domain-containing protein [Candidatus Hydrogenedentes bacterium]|nr:ankyrin repeat domain-containing protein [Candidatus Hydrogenedentota bacterium]
MRNSVARMAGIAVLSILGLLLCSCSPSPLDVAARGELELLAAMVEEDPSVLNYQSRKSNTKGKTPLHHAVTYGKLDVVKFLIDHEADVNLTDRTGMSPLHIASTLGRLDEAKALVRGQANVEAMDIFGDRPLHAAAIHGRTRMIGFLIEEAKAHTGILNSEGLVPYDLAVRERKTEAANRLKELTAGE